MESIDNPIFILHKYFINANYMRTLFDAYLRKRDKSIEPTNDPHLIGLMSLWYGCLYVVTEGWRDSKQSDAIIDGLLNSPLLNDLKGFRNDTFHYKNKYHAKRSMKFISTTSAARWTRDLNREFGRYFLEKI